jgi:hypothetical protein
MQHYVAQAAIVEVGAHDDAGLGIVVSGVVIGRTIGDVCSPSPSTGAVAVKTIWRSQSICVRRTSSLCSMPRRR